MNWSAHSRAIAAGVVTADPPISDRALQRWCHLGGLASAMILLPFTVRHGLFRDEAATIYAATTSWNQFVALFSHNDAVFAGYYSLARGVAALSPDPLIGLRLLSVLAFGVTVALSSSIGQYVGGAGGALAAGILVATNPMMIHQSMEARPYALVAACLVAAVNLMLRRRAVRAAATLAAAAIVLHVFAALVVGVLAIAGWLSMRRRQRPLPRGSWPAAILLTAVVAALAIVSAPQRTRQVPWIEPPRGWAILDDVLAPAGGLWVPSGGWAWAAVAVDLLIAAGVGIVLQRGHRDRGQYLAVLSWLLVPAAVLTLVSMRTPVFNARYVIGSVPAVGVLAALCVADLPSQIARAGIAVVAGLSGVVGVGALSAPIHQDGFEEAQSYLQATRHDGDVLATPSHFLSTAFDLRAVDMPRYPQADPAGLDEWSLDNNAVPDQAQRVRLVLLNREHARTGHSDLETVLAARGFVREHRQDCVKVIIIDYRRTPQ
ncbi:hypothetical protein KEM60_02204 [Austwickia sp. TVS 96-490-7B]|uniref:hypothetical protein n=1 Tax=Austwickia sp. TVS 96-490-7B TaxID=2830843 RepID=UPI001C56F7C7|nr:hypothetical protein [Austwickia sp. TVS 96-490-7B]MBW3085993.1 hypothetical protein [Austwickia sp. TVS 96-490-7B]